MLPYLLRRLAHAVGVVVAAATASFLLLHLAPGDPLSATLENPAVSEALRAHWRAVYGLDRPVAEQYVRYVASALRGDLGWSFSLQRPVAAVLADALPLTLLLVGCALGLGFALGAAVGLVQAVRPRAWGTRLVAGIVLLVYAVPEIWLALLLLVAFAYRLAVLPASGVVDVALYDYETPLEQLRDRALHLVLPAVTVCLSLAAVIARHQRAAMRDTLGEDFVRTARAKGASERAVLLRHAWRNALAPVVTLAGLALPALVGGVVLVEQVFAWPGMGLVAARAVATRDYPLVTGTVILASATVALGSVLADLAHAALDPRVRTAGVARA